MPALLHDVIEETQTTMHELTALFGQDVADLVAEVTDDKSPQSGAQASSGRNRADEIQAGASDKTRRQDLQYSLYY
jgi:(p)ppGpp synthase/HD superfamily hydrolase